MKINKWVVFTAIPLVLTAAILILYNSGRSAQAPQSAKIAVFIYDGSDPFISSMMSSLREIVSGFEPEGEQPLNVVIQDAQGSQQAQNQQIERYLTLGYDLLCVNLVDRTSAAYVIDKAMEADVPVIFFNREPVEADMRRWEKLYYVGTDAFMNGRLQGKMVIDAYREDPAALDRNGDGIIQYIMLEGEFRHQDAVLRTNESVQVIIDAGIQLEKLDGGVANWKRSQATALAKDYFSLYGEQIELIICNNDDMALGVLDYIADNGIEFTNIVGIDGMREVLESIESGRMMGTVVIDYQAQAGIIFDVAHTLLMGGDPVYEVGGMSKNRVVRAPMYVIRR